MHNSVSCKVIICIILHTYSNNDVIDVVNSLLIVGVKNTKELSLAMPSSSENTRVSVAHSK